MPGRNVCFVAPRDDIRIIVNIPGRYSLVSKLDLNGARREFACRVISMSTRRMGLVAPVSGPLGERVVTYIPRFGRLDGNIARHFRQGFVMSINGNRELRHKLAAKARLAGEAQEPRPDGGPAAYPHRAAQSVFVADAARRTPDRLPGDGHVGVGAGVSADADVRTGARVQIGHVRGRVVRAFKEGFAIQFDAVQKVEQLERSVIAS